MPICVIRSIDRINNSAYRLVFQSEIAEKAKPGQFVHIKCGQARILRRPISICGAANETVDIVFEVRGEGTDWLASRKTGDTLDILGPLGNGFPETGGRILLAGGGIGVPPLLFVAKTRQNSDAVLGFRSEENAMLMESFSRVCDEVYITSDDGSIGQRGFAADAVKTAIEKQAYSAIYACGPKAMLKSVADVAARFAVPCYVSLEERMGCGVGACLVCACRIKKGATERFAHVCKDGPVFNSAEVIWDD